MTEIIPSSGGLRSEREHDFGIKYADADYRLPPDKHQQLEASLVERVAQRFPSEEICAVWINPHDPLSNMVRTHEASIFPEAADFPAEAEDHTLLLALVDTRDEVKRVIHGATVMGPGLNPAHEIDESCTTGFYTIDSLIRIGNFTKEEFRTYFESKGVDVNKWITVESNFRIGDKVKLPNGHRAAALAYLAMFRLVASRAALDQEVGGVFATINTPTRISFANYGIEFEPLMGRTDLLTEEALLGEEGYQPVAIPSTPNNLAVFEQMNAELPTLIF